MGKEKVSKRVIHKSIKDFVYLMAAQSGISVEQASMTLKSIMSYMQQHPTHPLQRAIAALFGNKESSDDALMN
jgi:outer membrane protein assembly factor BamD (BamD/ComL family)